MTVLGGKSKIGVEPIPEYIPIEHVRMLSGENELSFKCFSQGAFA